MFDLTNTIRGFKMKVGKTTADAFEQLPTKDAEENFNHAAKQSLHCLFTSYCCCRFEEVDSTPLEGFDANALMKS
jgi:hypothetical protein